jgi:Tfp pilus assembly protein PilF
MKDSNNQPQKKENTAKVNRLLRYFQAVELQERKKYTYAKKLYLQNLAEDPKDSLSRRGLGVCLIETGEAEEGVKELKSILQYEPDNYSVFEVLAYESMTREDYSESLEYTKELLRLNPNSSNGHYFYAKALLNLPIARQKRQEIDEHLALALKIKPNDPDLYDLQAEVLWRLDKKFDQAENNYLKALELDPNLNRIHNNYGRFLVNIGRFTEGQEEIKLAAKIDPSNNQVVGNFNLLESSGLEGLENNSSTQILLKAKQIDPRVYSIFYYRERCKEIIKNVFKLYLTAWIILYVLIPFSNIFNIIIVLFCSLGFLLLSVVGYTYIFLLRITGRDVS